ncbi:MAG: glycosyltransferase family 2 protein [Sedimentisphaerales bacterium]|nr:glycosyltransferase family 2 protein [Sedimentisphaerales bacterium]
MEAMAVVNVAPISISVFFPCHNEEGAIEELTHKTLGVLEEISNDYEVIIVDDGGTDATGEIADRLARENEHVKVVHHPHNRGYGGALQSGFRTAVKEWVFYTDGDGQFDIRELPGLLDLTDDYDIIACYRMNRQDRWLRRLNGWAWNKLVGFVFGLKIRDIDCAFKLYRREIFDRIEMCSEGALIDTEILARAKQAGYSIVQRPVRHLPRQTGRQSGGNILVILRAFGELFKLRKKINATSKSVGS